MYFVFSIGNFEVVFLYGDIFMPPTSKKLRGHIGLGLSVRLCVRLSVRASSAKVTLTLGQEPLELGS